MAKMHDDELLGIIEREEGQSYGFLTSELTEEREKSLDYYLGRPLGNEVDGRSQVVSRDVQEVVEWTLPNLLKVFMSGDEVASFTPRGPEDIEQAEQETEYINHIITQKNEGFLTFYTWFKDALLQKVGYVKAWHEEKEDVSTESYEGLADEELALILQDPTVEVVEHAPSVDPYGMALHAVKIRKTEKYGCVRFEPVPPEEMLVSTSVRSVSLNDADFVEHRTYMSASDIKAMGYKVDDDVLGGGEPFNTEEFNRNQYSESLNDAEEADESMKRILVRDCYIKLDYDGDGIAELRRILIAGKKILENEEADLIPFSALCPVPMSHRHIGLSYADLVMDLQEIKTALTRGALDNLYLANNGRYAIDTARVNLDDMLTSRPGGVVRTKGDPAGAIFPLSHPVAGQAALQSIEYMDSVRENRTGITRYNQGIDANSLNKTASGVTQIMTAAQQRMELVARLFAETGVKDLVLKLHALTLKHARRAEIIRLRNQWVPVDPRQWKTRNDVTVSVGLGTGNKDQMLAHLGIILKEQKEALALGLAEPRNIYAALVKLTQNAGFKAADEFWTNPDMNPPQPPAPPQPSPDTVLLAQTEIGKEQIKAQVSKENALIKAQTDREIAREKALIEAGKITADSQNKGDANAINAAKVDQSREIDELRDTVKGLMNALRQAETSAMVGETANGLRSAMEALGGVMQTLSAPRRVIRDEQGRAVGVEIAK